MRVIVCVKQVVDLDHVKMNRETREPIFKNVPMVVGELEKNALEEAFKIKEKHKAEVIALSIGWPLSEEVILECLARGADRAVTLADSGLQNIGSQGVAKVLAKTIQRIGNYDIMLLGEASTDDNSGQVGPAVAQILGIPLIAYARQLDVAGNRIRVTQSFEDYLETIEAPVPVVVTVTSELNVPRIPSIIDVMDASAKPQQKLTLADIGMSTSDLTPYGLVKTLRNCYPEQARKGVMLKGENPDKTIDLLVENLMREGVFGN